MAAKKNYMLDTNTLLSNPNTIYNFQDNNVWLCGTVIQELDKHKNDEGETGYNARESIRIIKNLIKDALSNVDKNQRLSIIKDEGIPLGNGGRLFFEPDGVSAANLPEGYDINVPDNRIISSCVHLNKGKCKDQPVTLLTNDGGCFINSLVCSVDSDDVKHEEIKQSDYSGHLDLEVADYRIINQIHSNKEISIKDIPELDNLEYGLYENQFVTVTCGDQSALTVHQEGMLHKIDDQFVVCNGNQIKGLNKMQKYALWALKNPAIPLVILEGPAGTSKTFISLAAGLYQLGMGNTSVRSNHEIYDRICISRPNAKTTDADFGYLPGTLEEKMGPLIASYMDNLELILGRKDTPIGEVRDVIEDMMQNRYIELCPLYSIRGRSINNAYLICDEAQNASKKLIRDIVTRPCKDTKVIIAGDTSQVDNTFLDKRNNGLVYAKDCMKGSKLCAIIKFDEDNCVRSQLAEEAIKRMN